MSFLIDMTPDQEKKWHKSIAKLKKGLAEDKARREEILAEYRREDEMKKKEVIK